MPPFHSTELTETFDLTAQVITNAWGDEVLVVGDDLWHVTFPIPDDGRRYPAEWVLNALDTAVCGYAYYMGDQSLPGSHSAVLERMGVRSGDGEDWLSPPVTGFSFDPAYDERENVCPMCGEREQHPRGRRYRSPLDAERGTPVERLPRMCMECTVDVDAEGF